MSGNGPSQMPVGNPFLATIIWELNMIWKAIEHLNIPQRPENDTANYDRQEVVFSCPVTPANGDVSPGYHVTTPKAYVTTVRVFVTGSGSMNLELKQNGATIHTTDYDSGSDGDRAVEPDLSYELEEWDVLQVSATSVSESIGGVTVQVELMIPTRE